MDTKTANTIYGQIGDEVIALEGAELEALLQTQKEMQDQIKAAQTEAETKAKAKSELLSKLGITEAEAKLLLG